MSRQIPQADHLEPPRILIHLMVKNKDNLQPLTYCEHIFPPSLKLMSTASSIENFGARTKIEMIGVIPRKPSYSAWFDGDWHQLLQDESDSECLSLLLGQSFQCSLSRN
jgi:hypothetical protein